MDRAVLFYALRDHGLTPWRDVESLDLGDDTTEVIEQELAQSTGVILWVNEDVLASTYVAIVELPAIAKASRRGRLRIVPVFDGLSPTRGAERLAAFGIEIGESNGHVIDPTVGADVTAADIARRYVRAHVKDARELGEDPVLRLVSYDDTADLRATSVLNIDWRHHFASGRLDPAAESPMRSALTAATGAMKNAYGAAEITLAVKAHLPLAVAVGYAFAEPTGCTLRMPRDGVDWTTSRAVGETSLLRKEEATKGPVDMRVASVEVSVTRNVEAGVTAYLGAGHRYRHRLIFAPEPGPGRESLHGPDTANAWGRQIGDALTMLADRTDVDRIDLFLATPVELAVSIGWWANAAGPIGLMNWTGKTGPYERMWTLP
jgi:hypothetical protein